MEAEAAFAGEGASGEAEDSAEDSVVDSVAFEAGSGGSEEALAGSAVPSWDAASDVGLGSALGSALTTRGPITLIRPIPTTHTTDAILRFL